jgi:hypothetical protein
MHLRPVWQTSLLPRVAFEVDLCPLILLRWIFFFEINSLDFCYCVLVTQAPVVFVSGTLELIDANLLRLDLASQG